MEDDDLIVGRQAKIAFDAGACFKRGRERDEAVFRKFRTAVKTPVREADRTGPEGIDAARIRP